MAARRNARTGSPPGEASAYPHTFIFPDHPAGDHAAWCCTARCSAAICTPSARTRKRRASPASAPTSSSPRPTSSPAACRRFDDAVRVLHNSVSPSSFGNFYELYAIAAAVLGGCSPARRRGVDPRHRARHGAAAGAAEPRQHPGHPELAEFRGHGHGDPARRAGGPAIAERRRRAAASVARPREPGAAISPKPAQFASASPMAASNSGAAGAPGKANLPGAEP